MGWSPFVETTVLFRASRNFSLWPEIPGTTLIEITETVWLWISQFQYCFFANVSLAKQKPRSRSKLSIWLTYTRDHKSCQEQQAGHMVWSGNYSHRNSLSDGISCLNCKFIKQRDRAIDKTATKNSWDVKPNWRWKRKKNTNKVWGKFKILGSLSNDAGDSNENGKKSNRFKSKTIERFSTLKNGFRKCSLFVLSANGWEDQNMDSSFSRQRKP